MSTADVLNPAFNLVISNVPRPRAPPHIGDAQMTAYDPVSVITDSLGLNITVQSYRNNLDFGLLACRELVPDLWKLTGYVADAVDELGMAAATARE